MSLPARFTAPLANTYRGLTVYSSENAPSGRYAWGLRRGDASIIDELRRALTTIPATEDESTIVSWYARTTMRQLAESSVEVIVALRALLRDDTVAERIRTDLSVQLAAQRFALQPVPATQPVLAAAVEALVDELGPPRDYFGELLPPREPAPIEEPSSRPERALEWHANVSPADVAWLLADANRAVQAAPGGGTAVLEARPDAVVEVVVALEGVVTGAYSLALQESALEELLALAPDHAATVMTQPGAAWIHARQRSVAEEAAESGRLAHVRLETDQYPNDYDAILSDLAALVPELRAAVFEQVPHWDEHEERDPDQLDDQYRLRAYIGDRMYELIGGDATDWIDTELVLRCLNLICAEQGVPWRFVSGGIAGDHERIAAVPAPV